MTAEYGDFPGMYLERAPQRDLHLFVRTWDFPRIRTAEPVIRLFDLVPVLQLLPEDAEIVAQAVPNRRNLERGQGVDTTRREPTEAAVAEPRVRLLFNQVRQPHALRFLNPICQRREQQVGDIVHQGPADQ